MSVDSSSQPQDKKRGEAEMGGTAENLVNTQPVEELNEEKLARIEASDAQESLQTSHHAVSLADQKRQRSRPGTWVIYIVAALITLVVPYWIGRDLSINHTDALVHVLRNFDPRGLAIVSWLSVVVIFATLGLAVAGWHRRISGPVALLFFAGEQFLGGLALLKTDFWYSTYVVFHDDAIYANAINLGIISAVVGFGVFAVVFVAILVFIKRSSPLNVLTRAGSALASYLVIELIALMVTLLGGIITLV